MRVKRLSENAQLPQKAHAGDLGYDLYASEPAAIGEFCYRPLLSPGGE